MAYGGFNPFNPGEIDVNPQDAFVPEEAYDQAARRQTNRNPDPNGIKEAATAIYDLKRERTQRDELAKTAHQDKIEHIIMTDDEFSARRAAIMLRQGGEPNPLFHYQDEKGDLHEVDAHHVPKNMWKDAKDYFNGRLYEQTYGEPPRSAESKHRESLLGRAAAYISQLLKSRREK